MTRPADDLIRDYPLVTKVLQGFYDGTPMDYLDVVEVFDDGLYGTAADGRLRECVAEAQRLSAERADDDEELLWRLAGADVALPIGDLGTDLQLIVARARHWLEHGLPPVRSLRHEPAPLPRVSSWASRATAEAAVTEVLRANRSFVEDWAANPQGQPRIWMSADLGRELGQVMQRAERPGDDPVRVGSGVTQAVVVMARVPEGVFVQTSYPDLPLDPQWPRRFPDLAHVYGGWFGQDWDEEFGRPYHAFDMLTRRLHEPARGRAVAQLGELMALPEPEVRAALHALGSYAVPERSAAWAERLHWALASWPATQAVDEPLHSGGA